MTPAKEALTETAAALVDLAEKVEDDEATMFDRATLVAHARVLKDDLDSLVVLTEASLQEKARAAEGIALKCRRDGEYDLIPFYEGQASALRQLLSGSGRADNG